MKENSKFPPDVTNAIKLLEAWEKKINHSEGMRDFEDAIDILSDYKDYEDEELRNKIKNIKISYVRRLLNLLPSLPPVQLDEWVSYKNILLECVPNEVNILIKENPVFGEYERSFLKQWLDEYLSLLEEKFSKTVPTSKS